jgi:hypothetical protein
MFMLILMPSMSAGVAVAGMLAGIDRATNAQPL